MTKNSVAVPLSDDWRKVFPFEDTGTVVRLLHDTWNDLISRRVPKFDPGSREPHLTEFLRAVLKIRKDAVGLSGNFGAEELDSDADLLTGALTNRGRADIRYFSDRTVVDLTFEFKKLNDKPSSLKSYYGDSGMMRFVTGKYSRDRPLAFMVGLVESDFQKCYGALKVALAKSKTKLSLELIESAAGEVFYEPSRELPQHVHFDTEHSRLTIPDQSNLVICHLFLLYGAAVASNSAAAAA
jgi:hypothetical protein